MECFKVVRTNNVGEYFSIGQNCVKSALEYKIDVITRPYIGKLFVFANLAAAKRFCIATEKTAILKCETDKLYGPELSQYQRLCVDDVNTQNLTCFWTLVSEDQDIAFELEDMWMTPSSLPKGTMFADWVKPIEVL